MGRGEKMEEQGKACGMFWGERRGREGDGGMLGRDGFLTCFVGGEGGKATYEQQHFYANKATTEMSHPCLKCYKRRYTLVKRDRKLPAAFPYIPLKSLKITLTWVSWIPKRSKDWSACRTRSERDSNLHHLRPLRDTAG